MLNSDHIINEINNINDKWVYMIITGMFVEDEQDYIEFILPKHGDKKNSYILFI